MISADKLRAIPTDTLRELNRLVCEEIRWRNSQTKRVAILKLCAGMKATFMSKDRGMVRITITKVNRVTVHGIQYDPMGQQVMTWRVSPNLLVPEV